MIRNHRAALTALAAAFALSPLTPAFAVGPGSTVAIYDEALPTYAASVNALAPASAATDFLTITGSATKTVRVRSVVCSGTSTSAGSLEVSIVKRSALDTGGTSTTLTPVSRSTSDPAATAVVTAYTANPSALGTSLGIVDTGLLGTIAPASVSAAPPGVAFLYNYAPTDRRKPPTLVGATQLLAINANAGTFTTGAALACTVTWTEN
jgi:hypothetical protein